MLSIKRSAPQMSSSIRQFFSNLFTWPTTPRFAARPAQPLSALNAPSQVPPQQNTAAASNTPPQLFFAPSQLHSMLQVGVAQCGSTALWVALAEQGHLYPQSQINHWHNTCCMKAEQFLDWAGTFLFLMIAATPGNSSLASAMRNTSAFPVLPSELSKFARTLAPLDGTLLNHSPTTRKALQRFTAASLRSLARFHQEQTTAAQGAGAVQVREAVPSSEELKSRWLLHLIGFDGMMAPHYVLSRSTNEAGSDKQTFFVMDPAMGKNYALDLPDLLKFIEGQAISIGTRKCTYLGISIDVTVSQEAQHQLHES